MIEFGFFMLLGITLIALEWWDNRKGRRRDW